MGLYHNFWHFFIGATGDKPWDFEVIIYIHALSLAGLGVHVSSLSESMNAFILAQVELSQNSIHCCFFPGPGKG